MFYYYIILAVVAIFAVRRFISGNTNYKRKFESKTVVIVGASSGIGEELAYQISRYQPKLVLVARRAEKLHVISKKCSTLGASSVLVITADVSEKEQCRALVEKTVSEYSTIDVLFLNAGVAQSSLLFSMKDPDILEKVFQVDFYGAMYPAFYALPHLRKSRGHIVVTSSVYGKLPGKGVSAYCSAKHALHGFFNSLRIEEARNQIRVTMVCPGYVSTPLHDRSLGKDGKEVGPNKEGKSIIFKATEVSLRVCVQHILKATASNLHEVTFPTTGSVAVFFRNVAPGLFDRLVYGVK